MKARMTPVEGWVRVVRFEEPESGLDALIAIHDVTLGPACGGCRIRPYPRFEAALDDVTRLSRGMTYKNALGGIPFGGGKAVINADPKTQKTESLLRAFGRAVESLEGLYYTAEDSGVTEHDLDIVRKETKYVAGLARAGEGGNPSPFTARGVFRGVEAAARFRLGRSNLSGLRVAVLGAGAIPDESQRAAVLDELADSGHEVIEIDV
ncbi:MAG TPA: hypothetical protein DEA50_08255, partial [Parvularcula sp.]|nr:hypothetical protein [Parvularcula sp.]